MLVVDDWGLAPLTAEQCRDLLERLDARHGRRSTLVTSQRPVAHWPDYLGQPTLADASLERLVHNAYQLTLNGDSRRQRQASLTTAPPKEYVSNVLCRQVPGRVHSGVESAAGFLRNRRPVSCAIAGRFPSD